MNYSQISLIFDLRVLFLGNLETYSNTAQKDMCKDALGNVIYMSETLEHEFLY